MYDVTMVTLVDFSLTEKAFVQIPWISSECFMTRTNTRGMKDAPSVRTASKWQDECLTLLKIKFSVISWVCAQPYLTAPA